MPDGRVIFTSDRSGVPNLWIADEGSANTPHRLTNSANSQFPSSITSDGRALIFTETSETGADVLQMALDSTHQVTKLLSTPADERNGVVSPDRHWLAYQSDESGDVEVFVRPYPQVTEHVWPVSKGGGSSPLWSGDGKELFYVAASGALMRVAVNPGDSWNATAPTEVVKQGYYTQSNVEIGRLYDVDRTGSRFLLLTRDSVGDRQPTVSFVIVQNWFEELKRLVPVR